MPDSNDGSSASSSSSNNNDCWSSCLADASILKHRYIHLCETQPSTLLETRIFKAILDSMNEAKPIISDRTYDPWRPQ